MGEDGRGRQRERDEAGKDRTGDETGREITNGKASELRFERDSSRSDVSLLRMLPLRGLCPLESHS